MNLRVRRMSTQDFDNNDTSVSFQSNWTMNDIDDKPTSVVSHMSLRKDGGVEHFTTVVQCLV